MGGDLTGKAIVPVIRANGFYRATFLGDERCVTEGEQLEQLLQSIRWNGMYPWLTDEDEALVTTASAERQEELFDHVIAEEVRGWMRLADERLRDSSTTGYVIAGNDDPWLVDEALKSSESLCFCDDRVVRLGPHELLSLSYANPTPWDSPRELDEDELYRRLHALADQLEEPARAIFNLHVPPFDSGLDRAVKIDSELRVVVEGGSTSDMPVGSTAVRQIIEEVQPLLALHGHIHESRAAR